MPVVQQKKTMAVIDDDDQLREELVRHFESRYDVSEGSGDAGTLRELRAARPEVVLLDLDLTSRDGFELLRAITSDGDLHATPVLTLSSHGDFSTFERAHRLGAAEFVTKPFSPDDLAVKVDAVVSGRKLRSAGRLKLGAMLVASGLVTQTQLEAALARQRSDGGRLGELLVSEGLLSEQDIVNAVAGQMRIGVADLGHAAPQANALGLLPRDFIIRHRVIPLRLDDQGALTLAMTNPLDVITIDEVGMRTKRRIVPVICTESGFDEAVGLYFSARGKLKDARVEEAGEEHQAFDDIDASVIEIVDSLLTDAATMSASDIHLEPREDTMHVRCRIDGVLHELREFPVELQAGIISRLKIMANLNIAERRLPQDGRTSFELSSGEQVDLRLATIPSLYGENITIRILEVSALPPTLAQLGLAGDNLARFQHALSVPEGGICIVGPTGSGKSTTLYTTLELIKSPERKIYTVEDPVERKIDGVIQTEIKPSIGLTFAQVLRSLVRADPDVIMVGEIRDLETAKMAADSAVTGHLVFSTLHTSDASAAVNRLVEMGVPRYLVAAAWRCFVAQRLVRRLCPSCRRATSVTARRWEELGLGVAPAKRITIHEPVGLHQVLRHRLPRPPGPLRGPDRGRRPAGDHRHGRHRARHPAPRAGSRRRQSARRRRAQGARRVDQLPRAAARHRLTPAFPPLAGPVPRRLSHAPQRAGDRYNPQAGPQRLGESRRTLGPHWDRRCAAGARTAGLSDVPAPRRSAASPSAAAPSGTVVDDPLRLAFAALQLAGLDKLDLGPDEQRRAKLFGHSALEGAQVVHPAVEQRLGDLDLHLEGVLAVHAVEHDEVERLDALDGQQHLLDGRGEHVDAADDEHVVGAAHDLAHARDGTPAGALLVGERAEVARAVAQHRRALARDGRVHELADLAVGDRLAGGRVEALDDEVVLRDVHAVAALALAGHAGADDLGEAVVVGGRHRQALLDLGAELLAAGLRAEQAEAQLEVLRAAPPASPRVSPM